MGDQQDDYNMNTLFNENRDLLRLIATKKDKIMQVLQDDNLDKIMHISERVNDLENYTGYRPFCINSNENANFDVRYRDSTFRTYSLDTRARSLAKRVTILEEDIRESTSSFHRPPPEFPENNASSSTSSTNTSQNTIQAGFSL